RARRQGETLSGISRSRDRGLRNRYIERPRRRPEPDAHRSQDTEHRDSGRGAPSEPAPPPGAGRYGRDSSNDWTIDGGAEGASGETPGDRFSGGKLLQGLVDLGQRVLGAVRAFPQVLFEQMRDE